MWFCEYSVVNKMLMFLININLIFFILKNVIVVAGYYMSHEARKLVFGVSNKVLQNKPVNPQKKARIFKFGISRVGIILSA